jgi:hypothetical protein
MRSLLEMTQAQLQDSSLRKGVNANPINSVKDTAQLAKQFPATKKPTANLNNNLQATNNKNNKTSPNPLTNEKKTKRKKK